MKVEIEARYYGFSDKVVDKLYEDKKFKVLTRPLDTRRVVWDINPEKRIFLRVREVTGKGTEITLKRIRDPKAITGTDEYSISIHPKLLDEFAELFDLMGLGDGSYQETTRTTYRCSAHPQAKISWDKWPGLGPIIEIEGTEEEIAAIEKILELPERFPGDIADIYTFEYGISREELSAVPSLTHKVVKNWKKVRR